jgi:hypothetical protein
VKNDTLALMAVRAGLHRHLNHESTSLSAEIAAFVKVRQCDEALVLRNCAVWPSCALRATSEWTDHLG